MAAATLKAMLRTRTLKLGHFIVEFATPGIGYITRNAGCDFVVFDMEHSGFGYETVKSALRYFEAAGIAAIVRVPSKDYHHIARACDMGAEGIMLPMVNTAEEAGTIHEAMKYPPQGKRGVSLGVAHDCYIEGPVSQKLTVANERVRLLCQIESAEGVQNADAIAAVEGVDCLWVGQLDLSASLGIPGEFGHPKFAGAIAAVAAACRKHDKALGRVVPDVVTGIDYHKLGFDLICYSGDVWVLQRALSEAVAALRMACQER